MKRRDWFYLAILLAVIAFSAYRYHTRTYTVHRTAILLDTFIELDATGPEARIDAVADSTLALIKRYEDRLSYYVPGSNLDKLNTATADSLALDPDIAAMLALADTLWRLSDGHYDVSIGTLADLWDFDEPVLPDSAAIDSARTHVGWQSVSLGNGYIRRPAGMRINLGSIAKGYIIDKAVEYLQEHGAVNGYINAGGDIRYFGTGMHKVGIQHPRGRSGEDVIAELDLPSLAVVTSGDYERCFDLDGVRYHHIIDPFSGFPAQGTISVTVIAPTATLADGLSTTLFLVAPERAIDILRSFPGCEAIIYYRDGDGIVSLKSMGMKQYLVKEYE